MNEQRFNDAKCENRSDYSEDWKWETIDWKKAEEYVSRLQLRIVKAVEKRSWNLVKREKKSCKETSIQGDCRF